MVTRPIQALNFFQDRLGLNPMQAAGLVGNLMQESTSALNPSIIGDNGASFGIAQWQGPRRRALTEFANNRGTDPSDFNTQLEFLAHEAETTEAASIGALKRTENVGDAAAAAVGFFRPSRPHTERRQRLAMQVAREAGAGGDVTITPAGGGSGRGLLAEDDGGRITEGLLANGNGNRNGSDAGLFANLGQPDSFLGSTFLSNLGAGILAANEGGRPLGAVLGRGLLQANAATADQFSARNELARQELKSRSRRNESMAQLREVMAANPNASMSNPTVRALLFDIASEAMAKSLTAQPRGLQARFQATESQLGRPLTSDETLRIAGGKSTNINVNTADGDKPVSISDLNRIRMPDGSAVPLGTTLREAREMGARVVSSDEQKQQTKTDKAMAVLDELEQLAVGEDGIFLGIETDVMSRAVASMDFLLGSLVEQDVDLAQFESLSSGTIGSLIRSFGASGALSDPDVARAEALLPTTGSINLLSPGLADSEQAARSKIDTLRRLLSRGIASQKRIDRGLPPLRPGEDSGGAADFRFDPNTGDLVPVR